MSIRSMIYAHLGLPGDISVNVSSAAGGFLSIPSCEWFAGEV
jgi:hypothetical protein